MNDRSPQNSPARVPEQAGPVEPPAIGGRPFVPEQVGRVDPDGGADWFTQPAAPDFGGDAHSPRPSGAGTAGTPRRTSDGDGHQLFTHVVVPTQRLAARPAARGGAGPVPAGSERTELIPPRHLLTREPEPATEPPPGEARGRPGSISGFDRGGEGRNRGPASVGGASREDGPASVGGAGRGDGADRTPGAASTGTGGAIDPRPRPDEPTRTHEGARRSRRAAPKRGRRGGGRTERDPGDTSRRKVLIPVIVGAVLSAAVALASAGFTGSLVPGGPEDARTLPAAAPGTVDPARVSAGVPGTGPGGPSVTAAADGSPAPAVRPAPAAERGPSTSKPAVPAPTGSPRMIMVIRHGEKSGNTPGAGVDPAGNRDDHSLTPRGWSRARSLSTLFDPSGGATRSGIARPKVIYAAGPSGDGTSQRTRETVTPLAGRLGVPVDTSYAKGQEAALVRSAVAQSRRGPVLISWQHGEIPSIASELKIAGAQPPSSWPDARYDVVWTFSEVVPGTWKFSQTPQMLLPGDRGSAIR